MFIEEVMELVELNPLRNALVGLPGLNGLSTEQRKRLTIAVELVANPSIIFMDEPTSGLDARAAAIVMRAVRNTVNTGRTVVCTIHQPSIDIFEAFDEVRNVNCYLGFVFLIDIAGDPYMLFLHAVVPDEERWRGDLRRPIGSPVQRLN
jgi:ABC-type Mn2+/Zn2+ transport system ATPase subunit